MHKTDQPTLTAKASSANLHGQSKPAPKETQIRSTSFIIQKYIEAPLLIDQRKFDIRVWVLVTHTSKVYVFREGYVRTSSTEYTLDQDSILRPEVHLTNNAIQSQFDDYGKFESGNQLSFDEFDTYMAAQGEADFVYGKLVPDIKKLIKLSVEAAGPKL